jgi:homospermidine synthase
MNRILIVGYGSLGQGVTPLLFRHFPELSPTQVTAISADDLGSEIAKEYGITLKVNPLTPDNYRFILPLLVGPGDLLLNLSVDVSSIALIEWCQEHDVNYLDTCIEPWAGGYTNVNSAYEGTNHYLREQAISMKGSGKATAVIAHGANPGLVSYFVKEGLKDLAKRRGLRVSEDYAHLADELDVRVIQIAERDTQTIMGPNRLHAFINTWSVDGLISEAEQFSEMSRGTHELYLKNDQYEMIGRHGASVMNSSRGHSSVVMSWVPSVGEQYAYHITHHEAFSIADLLTLSKSNGETHYRPTVYYAYRPSNETSIALERMARGILRPNDEFNTQLKKVVGDQIESGQDELGVLFLTEKGSFWYGSTLTIEQARALVPHNSATTLQVTATIIGALKWIEQNPKAGVVEAEDIDYGTVMEVALPYLGKVGGVESEWRPQQGGFLQYREFTTLQSSVMGTDHIYDED